MAGAVALADLSDLASTTFGAAGFLCPAAGGGLVDAADTAWGTADDYHRTARGPRPDVGAFESPVTAPPLAHGFKP